MKVLVCAEIQDGKLTGLTRELATAAREIAEAGGVFDIALPAARADTAQGLGANRILTLPGAGFADHDPALHSGWLDRIVSENAYDLILFGCTNAGLDLGPVIAFGHELPLLSYCTAIRPGQGRVEADSLIYGGKLVVTAAATLPAVLLVNAGSFPEADQQEGVSEIQQVEAPPASGSDLRPVAFNRPDPDAVDITLAERLLCVGRGIGDQDAIEEARELAGLMGAELVGSRPVVDAGWLPRERQVGKSGRKVRPQLYLALGVSGAPEHLEGMRGSGMIVAINTDAGAPIFEHAHLGATVDIADFLPAFMDSLNRKAS